MVRVYREQRAGCGLELQLRVKTIRPAMIGIFFAIGRCHVGWIFIKIRSPDAKLLAVQVDRFPQTFA